MSTLYDEIGGEQTIKKIVALFYTRVQANDTIGHLFPEDLTLTMEKQTLFLTQFFGGPPLYIEKYGHPMLRARHNRFPIGEKEAVTWLHLMKDTINELELPVEKKEEMLQKLAMTAFHMINQ